MGGFSFESDFRTDVPVVFVDSEKYGDEGFEDEDTGDYHYGKDRQFFRSTGKDALDLNIILERFSSGITDFGFSKREVQRIIERYFVPVQDRDEILQRQAAVKDIFENEETREKVRVIIKSAKESDAWTNNFFRKTTGNFSQRTQQVKTLVEMVEAAVSLDVESERLNHVKDFGESIAATQEYQQLKVYSTECAKFLLKKYEVFLKNLNLSSHDGFVNEIILKDKLKSSELSSLYMRMLGNKATEALDLKTRRQVYNSLRDLHGILGKLMSDDLAGIIDQEEAKAFELEKRLNQAIKKIGSTSSLSYISKKDLGEKQKFFVSQFREVLTHVSQLIDEGLDGKMKSLNFRTNWMAEELSFYYGLSEVAKRMDEVAMPRIFRKETRKCSIKKGKVPSMLLRYEKSVPNDVSFGKEDRIAIITGPNDDGKTTYERMIGQIHALALVGSYVPAKSATISIVDGIFTSFGQKDKPGEKEGSFKSGLRFLDFISFPQVKDRGSFYPLDVHEANQAFRNGDNSFITPYSLVLLDEVAIGSDSEATEEAIERTIKLGSMRGSAMFISTHYHPIASRVQTGDFPGIVNMGAMMDNRYNPPKETYRIVKGMHAPSLGSRLFNSSGFTDARVLEGQEMLEDIGLVKG